MSWPNNVRKSDLKIAYYRGSGAGGQHRNKRDTACRITHIPTGESACAEDQKSQAQNRKNAFLKLANKLIPLMLPEVKTEKNNERIRTYNKVRDEVKDHRTGKTYPLNDILNGKLDELIYDLSVLGD